MKEKNSSFFSAGVTAFTFGLLALVLSIPTWAFPNVTLLDFSRETVGADPISVVPVVGVWTVGLDNTNKVLIVDGSRWKVDESVVDLVARVRALYGEGYAEFLDKLPAYAHFSYAVAKDVGDFREGEISLRFKPMAGKVDQAAGILFSLKPNGFDF